MIDRLVAFAAVFSLGVLVGGEWESRLLHEKMAVAVAEQGLKNYEKLRDAVDAKDAVGADLDRARSDLDRVRRALARREAQLAKLNDGAGTAGCEKLLSEAVEFLGECRERYLRCAANHDALIQVVE